MSVLRGLYPIVDLTTLDARGISPEAYAAALLPSEPSLLQLRAKDASDERLAAVASDIARLCEGTATRFVLNDRPDLALELGIAWTHIGQTDFPAGEAQLPLRWSKLHIGVSTHTPSQLSLALSLEPAYVAFGPVFDTTSKQTPDSTVGLAGLRAAAALAGRKGVPLVAIGGIAEPRLYEVEPHTDMVAVISALVPAEGVAPFSPSFFAEVTRRAESFQRAFRRVARREEPA